MVISIAEQASLKNAASDYNEVMLRTSQHNRTQEPNFFGHPVPPKFRWHLSDSSTKVLFGYPRVPRTLVLYEANLS